MTPYWCPFCTICSAKPGEIEKHCLKNHGKKVKATECQSPQVVKKSQWYLERAELGKKFARIPRD